MRILFTYCLFILCLSGFAQTHYVSNLNVDGNGSLRHTIANAPAGATIRFNPSLLDNGTQTLILDSNIIIDKELTIKGLYNTTDSILISGNNSTRIFQILNAGHIVLDSLILEHANTFEAGGGIYIYNTTLVTLKNSIIRNCLASNGGAIYGYTGIKNLNGTQPLRLHLIHTLIHNNSAHNHGGGIYYSHTGSSPVPINNQDITPKRLQFDYSTICNNTATYQGGGICHLNTAASMSHNSDKTLLYSALKIDMNGCTIFNNQANEGGAIYNQINSSHFKAIKQLSGPADHYLTTKVNFINTTLLNNNSFSSPEVYSTTVGQVGSPQIISSNIITVGSSIIANSQQAVLEMGSVNSLGYNIFSDQVVNGHTSTDKIGVLLEDINLGEPDCYGESKTPTLLPLLPSVAINQGNPNDLSKAQTGSLFGIRDIGSAETCKSFKIDTRTEYNSLLWLDNNLYTENNSTATYTTTNAFNCDSVIFLDLIIYPLSEMSVYPNPIQKNQDIEIFLGNHINAPYTVELTNLQGRIIESYNIPKAHGRVLKLSNLELNPGIYFMNNSHSKKSVKLIVL